MLPHPRSANLARDAIGVVGSRELQDQDEVPVIDLRNTRGERSRIDNKPHSLTCRLHGRLRHRLSEAEVVDDNVHRSKLPRSSAHMLRVL